MKNTILLLTLGAELGIVVGWCFCWCQRFIAQGRATVLAFANAIGEGAQ